MISVSSSSAMSYLATSAVTETASVCWQVLCIAFFVTEDLRADVKVGVADDGNVVGGKWRLHDEVFVESNRLLLALQILLQHRAHIFRYLVRIDIHGRRATHVGNELCDLQSVLELLVGVHRKLFDDGVVLWARHHRHGSRRQHVKMKKRPAKSAVPRMSRSISFCAS